MNGQEAVSSPPRGPVGDGEGGRNRLATASLIGGIFGATGLGVITGLVCGVVGLARSRRRHGRGKLRCWAGIALSLLWAGAIIYLAPDVAKAADPGCTAFKERALSRYDRAIEDFDARVGATRTSADLHRAAVALTAAAARSRNTTADDALRKLAAEVSTAAADEVSGQVPGSVMLALNQDAGTADKACGTL